LVLNEAIATFDNDGRPWPEQCESGQGDNNLQSQRLGRNDNPYRPTPAGDLWPRDNGQAILQNANGSVYRLLLTSNVPCATRRTRAARCPLPAG